MREELENLEWDNPRREEIQKEINRIEQYCIDKGYGNITSLTIWNQTQGGGNPDYPYHTGYVKIQDIGMVGELNGTGINYNRDKSVHHCQKCPNI